MSLKGGCPCGAVTLDVAAETPAVYANCHCSQCRRMGRPFGSWAVFPADKVKVSYADQKPKEGKEGKEKKEKEGKKNKHLIQFTAGKDVHSACKNCGAALFKRPGGDAAPVYVLSTQVFASDDKWKIPAAWGQPLNLYYGNRVVDVPGPAELKFVNKPTGAGGDGTLYTE